MIKREVIEELGLFDPKYFMYYEDMDLCYRYKKNGYFSVILPSVTFVHIGGQSGLYSEKNNKFLNKHIQYSKFLFLKSQTNFFNAYFLFFLIKVMPYYFRISKKLKVMFHEK
jgi:GT2 family glycosyltransferase